MVAVDAAAVGAGSVFVGTAAVFSAKAAVLLVLPDGVLAGDCAQAARITISRMLLTMRCKRRESISLIFLILSNLICR